MTQIEQIRAEIERLKGQLIRGACAAQIEMETNCKEEAYNEVLSVLDTLQEPEVDLETELEDWRHSHFKGKRDGCFNGEYLERDSQLSLARHFAKWGAEHLKK